MTSSFAAEKEMMKATIVGETEHEAAQREREHDMEMRYACQKSHVKKTSDTRK